MYLYVPYNTNLNNVIPKVSHTGVSYTPTDAQDLNSTKEYTVIAEDGGNISQGQKQLLCIARVMLCLPPMLILDEATSSIDTRTEVRIQKAFARMMQGRASFIVAHRLSTIREADVILVMKDGHIEEQCNHDQLQAQGGFYAKLYNSQFEGVQT